MKVHNLVYKITNNINGNIYIGVHITHNIEDNYMGSGTNIKKAIKKFGKENFTKEILADLSNKDEMLDMEAKLVNEDFTKRKDTYNISRGGGGWNTFGFVSVIDKDENTFSVSVNDPRYLSGELVSVNKGMVTVRDENGKCFNVPKNDPRLKTGILKHISKNKFRAKDKEGNTYYISNKDERYLSGDLVGVNKGTTRSYKTKKKISNSLMGKKKNLVGVKDKNGNVFQVDLKDPRYLSGELISVCSNTICVKDKNGKCFRVSSNDPRLKTGELVGHAKGRMWIHNKKLNKSKQILKENFQSAINMGWEIGRK